MRVYLFFGSLFLFGSFCFGANSTEGRRLISGDNESVQRFLLDEIARLENAVEFGDDDSAEAHDYLMASLYKTPRKVLTREAMRKLMSYGLCDSEGELMEDIVVAIEGRDLDSMLRNMK